MPRTRPPTPSVIVSVAVDKALADGAAALYQSDLTAGVPHTEAALRARRMVDDEEIRRVLAEGLDHARRLEKRQHTEQLEAFARQLAEMRTELRRAHDENVTLRAVVQAARDPRRESG